MFTHTGAGYRNGNDVPVPYLITLPSSWRPRSRLAPSRRLAQGLEDGRDNLRDSFIFLMASSSRNPIRGEINRQLHEARKLRGPRRWVSSTGASRIELRGSTGTGVLTVAGAMEEYRRAVFCVAPVGDSDGFTTRFYHILAAGCIPVRVDTYYPEQTFEGVAWPFKQSIEWERATILVPPRRLRAVGLLPTLANVSAARVADMQQYIRKVVRPRVLYDYRGNAPDAFSAFLTELLHLKHEKLKHLDRDAGLPFGKHHGHRPSLRSNASWGRSRGHRTFIRNGSNSRRDAPAPRGGTRAAAAAQHELRRSSTGGGRGGLGAFFSERLREIIQPFVRILNRAGATNH